MKKTSLILFLLATISIITTFCSCGEKYVIVANTTQADSLINIAYKNHNYDSLIILADSMQKTGELSDMKACYWRGYAFSRQQKMRLAESNWQRAISLDIQTDEDKEYYAKSANRLAGILLLKGEYEATMKVAIPAMEMMEEAKLDESSDYTYLLVTVGCCQLKLEKPTEAAVNFDQAYLRYSQMTIKDPTASQYTSAIVGVITITDNYLLQKRFTEAFYWVSHLEELLNQYQMLPDAEQTFFDKQKTRLNLYRATALEGLGQHAEAAKAYDKARLTDYARTNEGKLEATTYLMAAKRWEEAAHNFEIFDEQVSKYGIKLSLDIIQHYLLPKYRANVGAQQLDSAVYIGMEICTALDSAIVQTQQDEALELATLYNLQQKETVFVQQKADMARQRMVATIVALALIILFFVLIIFFRHKAAMRLETAYYQLEIANEKTKESSRMKTSFIHQMSHEIRTPLNILSGFAQIISTPDIKLDEETKQDMNRKIMENTVRITELVNKMLEMSEASSKTVIERTENIPAIQIAVEAMNAFPIGNKYKIPIDLQQDNSTNDVRIQTNEQAATRALALLLGNAEKYTREGAIHLKVDVPSDKVVRYTVEDTGIGVPKAEAEHIFEEFVQLDENNEGTGIGLTVARSIANRLGGDVVLDTTYTSGARFIMTLPLNK